MADFDRANSFSVKPEDTHGQNEIAKLRAYAKRTGISFSVLCIRAITLLNKELKI